MLDAVLGDDQNVGSFGSRDCRAKTRDSAADHQDVGSLLWKLRGLEGDEVAALEK